MRKAVLYQSGSKFLVKFFEEEQLRDVIEVDEFVIATEKPMMKRKLEPIARILQDKGIKIIQIKERQDEAQRQN